MAPRTRVRNPFKEQRNLWAHYTILCLVAFCLTFLVIRNESGLSQHQLGEEDGSKQQISLDAAEKKFETAKDRHMLPQISLDDDEDFEEVFESIGQSEFPTWLHNHYRSLKWHTVDNADGTKLTRDILLESLTLGCSYISQNQKSGGSFNYQYDFVEKQLDEDDSQVRQAGALWGVALCYQYYPSNEQFKSAVERGIQFFMDHSVAGPEEGTILVKYLDDDTSGTGTNALFGLAMIDYLRTVESSNLNLDFTSNVRIYLQRLIKYLQFTQRTNKHFADSWDFEKESKSKRSSSYYDGETMLCLIKAAKYLDEYAELIPLIEEAAPILAKAYTIDVWVDEHDSDQTKGFYQWSSMFFTEYYQAGWSNAELFGDYVITLGHWIIHTHRILSRLKNTGYAYEGIISAYQIAKNRNHEKAIMDFESTIDQGLYKLTTWQVGGPLAGENEYLKENPTDETIAIGGVMNAKNEAPLRIDTTQHQMHAIAMALTSVYQE